MNTLPSEYLSLIAILHLCLLMFPVTNQACFFSSQQQSFLVHIFIYSDTLYLCWFWIFSFYYSPSYTFLLNTNASFISISPVCCGCRTQWLHLCRGVRAPNDCPRYDSIQSDGRAPVILDLGQCGLPFHCHCSQVYSGSEWSHITKCVYKSYISYICKNRIWH